MEKYVLVVESNCSDPAREAEFNDWYDKVHIPDVLETPGFVRATRYVNNDPPAAGKGKFLAVYEIETDDIARFLKANNENLAKKRAAGRFTELLVIAGRGLYKQSSSKAR